jgi:predicted DNA-binding transcriptional regulator AlpA
LLNHHHLDRRAGELTAAGVGNLDDLLTTKHVAAWLGVSVQTLEIWRCKRKGPPFVRLGPRSIRYRRGDVLAWLAERVHACSSEYQDPLRNARVT